jgi:hypothetical protein
VDSKDGYQEATAMYVRYEAGLEFQARHLEHNVIILPPQLSYNSLLL